MGRAIFRFMGLVTDTGDIRVSVIGTPFNEIDLTVPGISGFPPREEKPSVTGTYPTSKSIWINPFLHPVLHGRKKKTTFTMKTHRTSKIRNCRNLSAFKFCLILSLFIPLASFPQDHGEARNILSGELSQIDLSKDLSPTTPGSPCRRTRTGAFGTAFPPK